MIRVSLAIALGLAASTAMAQMSPVGLWRQVDDKTGQAKSEIRIVEEAGSIVARIEKRLDPAAKPEDKCDECKDDRKGKPLVGLEIIRGVKKVEGKEVWEGGKILDPADGKEYNARLTPIEGGKKMEMRGSIAFFGRTQTWTRIQ
ncbi:MAG: DUF2147 domain-containing protein [Rhodoferax sp.]|jgi:uncharacterized protein (DUF2147 family)